MVGKMAMSSLSTLVAISYPGRKNCNVYSFEVSRTEKETGYGLYELLAKKVMTGMKCPQRPTTTTTWPPAMRRN